MRAVLLHLDIGGHCHPFIDSVNSVRVEVKFIDMLDAKESIEGLLQDV